MRAFARKTSRSLCGQAQFPRAYSLEFSDSILMISQPGPDVKTLFDCSPKIVLGLDNALSICYNPRC